MKGLISLGLVVVAVAGWLWLSMLSPWFYDRPESLAPVEDRQHDVFVYGTLRFAPVRWLVMGSTGTPEPAVLEGYRREGLDLKADDDAQVEGLRLEVSADELRRLDRYERLGIRYQRDKLKLKDGTPVWVYRRFPEHDTSAIDPLKWQLSLLR
ncbi:gamma-glutamylcyclotransferase family protein [Vreelandella rituensis]|uniref:Gamma-glutamylcyclotransferase n=1 Tax=Vreelandella rituensis TaxID=2282306 RepID=A0A368U4M3_9GAMM|nr:gamma-glutamylcyclotransferase family protein [Halomonas rituensis]RCV92119.1 gamma-glutamylcyclotransferase [Halomonas rituensis]